MKSTDQIPLSDGTFRTVAQEINRLNDSGQTEAAQRLRNSCDDVAARPIGFVDGKVTVDPTHAADIAAAKAKQAAAPASVTTQAAVDSVP